MQSLSVRRPKLHSWHGYQSSPRLASVCLKGVIVYLTVAAVYAPTLYGSEEEKDSFMTTSKSRLTVYMLIVAGDWNARPGPKDVAAWHILGKLVLRSRCANGDRLVNFASANRLVVSSTRFQHPQRPLVMWFSNDGRARNQIDHMP